MAKKIDGKALAEKIKDDITKEIFELKGARPNLAIILVGTRSDSELFVALKEREAKKVGIDTHLYRCDVETKEEEILGIIEHLNSDDLIDGILVQLPLPKHINTNKITQAINASKDVDGFHPENKAVLPPVHETVLEMLKSINCDLKNKQTLIISNSDIFGNSLFEKLKATGAEGKMVGPNDKDLAKETKQADVLITAVGKAHLITKDMVKNGAVVIDIGITKKDTLVFGDVDYANVFEVASHITPVPGGVGPMTIAILFKNTLKLFKQNK